ncbi:unnamed protein product [Effrenium voratum]|uniref:Uncharacterized protein n=1 Tax=Effrenium voratum TaxID=2562239 RepID=A0AA36J775_9DINO|nr:unnamed protein product [Effrenium voratum]CAJ1459316.1 unnamed protein product [Effrenium voratum]
MSLKLPTPARPGFGPGGLLSPVARTRPILPKSFTADSLPRLDDEEGQERPAPTLSLPRRVDSPEVSPRGAMAKMGLPSILQRRHYAPSPRWTCAEEVDTWSHLESERALKAVETPVAPHRRHNSILDFERLFTQFFVQVRPSRWRGLWADAGPVHPEDVAAAWAEHTAKYIVRHAEICLNYWPYIQLEYESVHQRVLQEMEWAVEWSGKRYRVEISLLPERVCHRLLWALGDALLPDQFLHEMQRSLQALWQNHHFRTCDSILRPWGTFQMLLVLCSFFLVLCAQSADFYGRAVYGGHGFQGLHVKGGGNARERVAREEAMDHLASRLLFLGGLGHLWIFYMVASFFPLRSLHSPFHRDLGSMAAYSKSSLRVMRVFLPLVSCAKLAALWVRFERLQLRLRLLGGDTALVLLAATLPLLAVSVCVAVRSSFYSHYHFSSVLLAGMNGLLSIGFARYLEVGWAVLCVAAVLMVWLLLFAQYTSEFTKANLIKAAQIQWAFVHGLVLLTLVLALALEVEAGFARRFVHFFCESQTLVPSKVCKRLLSGH